MKAFIRSFDGLVRRGLGVFEFCDEPACLFRIQVARAAHRIELPDGDVPAGAQVVELHIWNEHIRPIPAAGPDLTWARQTHRQMVSSFRSLADYVRHNPRTEGTQAIGGATVLIPSPETGTAGLIRRLGFTVTPYINPLGPMGEFWENLYTWGLMWAFNMPSLNRRRFAETHRYEMWMSAVAFLSRYGS